MKKTVDVEIAGVDFILNIDAYELLEKYLKEMEGVFDSLPEKKEIVEDIESRIAEELVKLKVRVIYAEDVTKILTKIGSPEEIYEVLGEFDYDEKREVKAKLYRDPDNAIIGGVCSGLAAYLNVDPIVVRLFFIIMTLAFGFGILVYIILFFVMPPANTPLQKMEMRGGGSVLKKIDQGLKDLSKRFRIQEMTQKFEETIKGQTQKEKKSTVRKTVRKRKTVKEDREQG